MDIEILKSLKNQILKEKLKAYQLLEKLSVIKESHNSIINAENEKKNISLSDKNFDDNKSFFKEHIEIVKENVNNLKKQLLQSHEKFVEIAKKNISIDLQNYFNELIAIKDIFQQLLPNDQNFDNLDDKFKDYSSAFIEGISEFQNRVNCNSKTLTFSTLDKQIEEVNNLDCNEIIKNELNNEWKIVNPIEIYYKIINNLIQKCLSDYEEEKTNFIINDAQFIEFLNDFLINKVFFYIIDEEIYKIYLTYDSNSAKSKDEIKEAKFELCRITTIHEIPIIINSTLFDPEHHIKMGMDQVHDLPDMIILNVLKKGYKIGITNKIINKADVVVNYNFRG